MGADTSGTAQGFMSLPSGQRVYYLDPQRTTVLAEDLFRGLRNQRRFQGHLDVSVLAHLALCTMLAEARFKKARPDDAALKIAACSMHDAHEAYFPDLTRPLKGLVPGWKDHEARWEAHVHQSLGIPWPLPSSIHAFVKEIDNRAVVAEVTAWEHPLAETEFYPFHGGPPSDSERDLGSLAKRMSDAGRWAKVRAAVGAVAPDGPLAAPVGWLVGGH